MYAYRVSAKMTHSASRGPLSIILWEGSQIEDLISEQMGDLGEQMQGQEGQN